MTLKKTKVCLAVFIAAASACLGAEKLKVACIGDSITYGLGLPGRETQSYPAQLQKLLDARFPGKYEVRNFGDSGRGVYLDTMRGAEKRGFRHRPQHRAAVAWKPDIVVCNLGINDCGEYIKEYTGERPRGTFERDYRALLGDYAPFAREILIWTKLAPLAEGQRFHRSAEPFLMQADLESVARRTGARGIDMQEPLREKMDSIFARDKIHPNAEGARIIAEATFRAIAGGADSLPARASLPPDAGADAEVWLCAGQSNMQKGWGEFNATPEEKERVRGEMARLAKTDVRFWDFNTGGWTRLTPANWLAKCALGTSFAIRRAEKTGKTVCILYVAAGGAPTESFLSETTMCATGRDGKPLYPALAAIATNRRRLDRNADFPCKWVAREYPRRRANRLEARWWPVSAMYDAGIARIKGLPITGVLWYQGESNATTCVAPDEPTPEEYQLETLRAVLAELRGAALADGSGGADAPILVMGLPAMDRPWARYRETQKRVCREAGAIYVDTFAAGLGDLRDVHPRDKIPFAELALKALEDRRR